MLSTSLAFMALAATDALNPATVGAMVMLLMLPRPLLQGAIFLAMTFVVYLLGAILLVEGWTVYAAQWLAMLPPWSPAALLLSGSGICFLLGLHFWRSPGAAQSVGDLAMALTPAGTAVFAVLSTLSDLPTAVPLFAAVVQVPQLAETRVGEYLWLVLYTAIYVSPLVLLLWLRCRAGTGAEAVLERVQRAIAWAYRHIMPPAFLVAAAILGYLGFMRLLA